MTETVRQYLDLLQTRKYRQRRTFETVDISERLKGYGEYDALVYGIRLEEMLKCEKPILYPNDRFGFHRYQQSGPTYVLDDGTTHPNSPFGNIAPNYMFAIQNGFDKIIVYYDYGQIELAKILISVFNTRFSNVEFRKIETNQYKLSQAADLICTVEAIAHKTVLSKSETEFFHSKNAFEKNIYKNIVKKKF